jgi:hypothetical protein
MPREAIIRVLTGTSAPPERADEVGLVVEDGRKEFTSEVLQRLAEAGAGISAALEAALRGRRG